MDHVAIMRKSWGIIPKILDGRKKVESRWSLNRIGPWGKVKKGDRVYFKNSGEKIIAKAFVSKVIQFDNLTPIKVKEILIKYGGENKIAVSNINNTYIWAKEKKYCTLIYLEKATLVVPFGIDKQGFGSGAAWLSVENIKKVKK